MSKNSEGLPLFRHTSTFSPSSMRTKKKGDEGMKKVQFVHHYGYGEHEKDIEVVEFPEGTTDEEIQNEFEQFVWEKIGDDFYWEEEG